MKYRVKILKAIKAEDTHIGIGAIVLLRCASKQVIALLREAYEADSTSLIGDVKYLFSFDGVGINENEKFFGR